MSDKNRDIEAIKAFCRQFQQFCDSVTSEAQKLKNMAYYAEGSLRDQVGQRATQRVMEFSDELINIVDQGVEPVRELERKAIQMEEDMERIQGIMER